MIVGRQSRKQQQTEARSRVMELRHQGARCGNCCHFGSTPLLEGTVCWLQSDSDGYVKVSINHLCHEWKVMSESVNKELAVKAARQ
jgi:hypothetical protein